MYGWYIDAPALYDLECTKSKIWGNGLFVTSGFLNNPSWLNRINYK